MSTAAPYPGLRPFQHSEAHLFFGRERQVAGMLSRLEAHRFLAVVGASGCGKSSLVRAGLIPALEQGFLFDAHPTWRIAVMQPRNDPFDNLSRALLQDAALGPERQHENAGAILEATLRRGPLGLVEAVAESNLPEGTNLLLLVDQFEEIFRYRRQAANPDDADAFVNLLLAATQSRSSQTSIYVVITMRSDFIGDCALFRGLPEAINDSQFLTPRLTWDQYQAAIVEPAKVGNGQLSSTLVNRLLYDLRDEPDQLPVLQHVLMRMWMQAGENGSTRHVTLEHYQTIGGLAKALSEHCDKILEVLNPEQQRLAEVMFRALCERGSDQRDTRRPVKLAEVTAIAGVEIEAIKPVVDAFRGEGRNFLAPPISTPLEAETTLDISHESLIRHWRTLNAWVVTEGESARQYQRLEDAAIRHQQGIGELWRGVDLISAQQWKARQVPTQNWAARYGEAEAYPQAMAFLQQSEAAEKAQQERQEQERQRELDREKESAKRSRRVAGIIGMLLLFMIGVAIYALYQQNLASQAEDKAQREAVKAKGYQQRAEVRLAHYFSAASKAQAQPKPQLSVLLSIEALKASPIPAAEEALRQVLANIPGIPLRGHKGEVLSVAFSPDNKRLASASSDRTVRIWNANDTKVKPAILKGHNDIVHDLAFSPDGQRLASASSDQTIRIWNPDDPNAEPIVLKGHDSDVFSLAFSPDGRQLASAGRDHTVRIWNPDDPKAEPIILRGHNGIVYGVAFSPDGKQLASASSDTTVRIWNLNETGAAPTSFRGHTGIVYSVAFSPNCKDANCKDADRKAKRLASASSDQTIRIWNLVDAQMQPAILRGHDGSVWDIAFSPDGQRLASASRDKTVRIWDPDRALAPPVIIRGHEGDVQGVAFSPDGRHLASASSDKTARIWNPGHAGAEPLTLKGHEYYVNSLTFSPDSSFLASASRDHTVRLWKPGSDRDAPTVLTGHQGYVYSVAFSPAGKQLASASQDRTVRIWNPRAAGAEPAILRGHDGSVLSVAFSPDGQRLASASRDKTVRIWHLNSKAEPLIFRGHAGSVYSVVFSPDGKQLASASRDQTVRIWNPKNPSAEPAIFRGHKGVVYWLAFSPDGQQLASASEDQTVRTWNPKNPSAKPTIFRGHEGEVYSVAFSPDGQRLASAGEDRTARIWNPNDASVMPTIFRGHEDKVFGVAFSPDGKQLASASRDETVRVWTLSIAKLIQIACRVTGRNFSKEEWQNFQGGERYRQTCPSFP